MEPEEYRKMAGVEDRMWYYRALHRNVRIALGNLPEPAALLDAGCGTGGLLRKFEGWQPGWRLTGIDFSSLACDLARSVTSAEIVRGSVLELPFPDAAFDAVLSCDVLCQIEEPRRAMQEFFRCLRPGGRVVLTMPAYAWMYSYHDRQVGNLRRYSRGGLSELIRSGGFHPVSDTFWNMLPFPLVFFRRKLLPAREGASDVRLYPALVEATLSGMMALEQSWLRNGGRLPFGSTIMMVGVKPLAV